MRLIAFTNLVPPPRLPEVVNVVLAQLSPFL